MAQYLKTSNMVRSIIIISFFSLILFWGCNSNNNKNTEEKTDSTKISTEAESILNDSTAIDSTYNETSTESLNNETINEADETEVVVDNGSNGSTQTSSSYKKGEYNGSSSDAINSPHKTVKYNPTEFSLRDNSENVDASYYWWWPMRS